MGSCRQSIPKKGSDLQRPIKYLVFHISQGQWNLDTERKQAACSMRTLTTRREIHEFLGAAEFWQIWIPNFSLLAKPLYKAKKGGKREPIIWGSAQHAFRAIKKALVSVLALGLQM
jgi:hypothetical protein